MANLSKLFEPGRIGKLEIENRMVMAPMGTRSADGDGFITDRTIDYYVARARGGVGLIVSESSDPVRSSRLPKTTWIHDDKFIPKLRELTKAVHDNGGKIAMQLVHRGIQPARAKNSYLRPAEIELVVPTAMPYGAGGMVPKEATKEDIHRYVEEFSDGVRRARDAGFDGVEFHGAHGYLICLFLSPLFNRRTDEYGGSVENRTRFAREILRRSKEKAGADFPLIFRMNGSDFMPGGIDVEDAKKQAPLLVAAGADALHISSSTHGSYEWQFLTYMHKPGTIVFLAEAIKKVVDVPVITVGKIGDPLIAEQILEDGRADYVAMGRALLADPDLPKKAREGRLDDIVYCQYCNNCTSSSPLQAGLGDRGITRCTVNPALLREAEFVIKPAPERKMVLVAGGGLAGMEAARVLAERGHRVTLYERNASLGGQWGIAEQQEDKKDFARLTARLIQGLEKADVQVKLGQPVTRALVDELKPDAVVVATGADPATPAVPGATGSNVVQANDVITGKAEVGQRVVVVGGRYLGMEIALSLAEKGKDVSLVTRSELGRAVEHNVFRTLRGRLIKAGVPFYPNSPLREVRSDGVYVVNNNDMLFLPADTVVLAVGVESNRGLAKELEGSGAAVHVIGDAVRPSNALEATAMGAEIGRRI